MQLPSNNVVQRLILASGMPRYLNAKTDEERAEVEGIRSQHREHVSYTRRRAEGQVELSELAVLQEYFLTVVIDGMDSKKAQVNFHTLLNSTNHS